MPYKIAVNGEVDDDATVYGDLKTALVDALDTSTDDRHNGKGKRWRKAVVEVVTEKKGRVVFRIEATKRAKRHVEAMKSATASSPKPAPSKE